ncbi:predicted protein [Chaetoceros tenuissimus]|uniref:Uncharacterized protein n=1 Tax=Chaetoceros tenuissimus TaxID=426638 RepID=A0AAD3D626_9STRA|nr:predicted protein [Chaetoceros tenuissimus]
MSDGISMASMTECNDLVDQMVNVDDGISDGMASMMAEAILGMIIDGMSLGISDGIDDGSKQTWLIRWNGMSLGIAEANLVDQMERNI